MKNIKNIYGMTDSSRKRMRIHIKSKRSANIGVPPLKDQGILITDPTAKAQVLNNQFNLAFSEGKEYSEMEWK